MEWRFGGALEIQKLQTIYVSLKYYRFYGYQAHQDLDHLQAQLHPSVLPGGASFGLIGLLHPLPRL